MVAGVGGQGVLTVANLLATAAAEEGLVIKQAELHGMAQRGGAVEAMLRLADAPIAADVVPRGEADLVLGLEPLEALRHVDWLAPGGALVTSADTVADLAAYPPDAELLTEVRAVPGALVVPAGELAREAGVPRAPNMVMLGAAIAFLPLRPESVADAIAAWAERRQVRRADRYRAAFDLGMSATVP